MLIACAIGYAVRAEALIVARIGTRIAGTQLALDPVVRRQDVARHALASLAQSLPARRDLRVAVFSPRGSGKILGARTGREYSPRAATGGAYSLIEASLDGGGAVRLFFPTVDSIAFIDQWQPRYADYELFLASQDGTLLAAGSGPDAHKTLGRWLLEHGWFAEVRDYLSQVLERYPEDADIRLLYASALIKLGERSAAVDQLARITRSAPGSDAGEAAAILVRAVAADSTMGAER
jgi:predicted Zn-dependent protease